MLQLPATAPSSPLLFRQVGTAIPHDSVVLGLEVIYEVHVKISAVWATQLVAMLIESAGWAVQIEGSQLKIDVVEFANRDNFILSGIVVAGGQQELCV